MTEQELLIHLSNEDPSALQELIGTYFPILSRFAEKILGDPSLAQDVAQETFIKFWNAGRSFE